MPTQPGLMHSIGLLILRLGVGGYMFIHGWGKVQMLIAGQFEMFGDPIGIGSVASLVLVTLAEFVCAGLVMVGLGTRLAAAPVAFAMTVAVFVAHHSDPWTMDGAYRLFMAGESEFPLSKEPAMMFLIVFLALVFTGAGRLSLDALIGARLRAQSKSAGPDTIPA